MSEGSELEIRLIISNELSREDAQALRDCHNPEERTRLLRLATDKIIDLILSLKNDGGSAERVSLFAWLVAQGHVKLKFAFPTHIEIAGIFHEKIGVFDFPWGDRVAFTGSANETISGHVKNYESIDVYRSWIEGDSQRVETKALQFDEAWAGQADGLEVVALSQKALLRLKEVSRSPKLAHTKDPNASPTSTWAHQDEAISRFLKLKRGILEMATGTGKTRTALRILSQLMHRHEVSGAIVATDGNDLLSQWCAELVDWLKSQPSTVLIYRHFGSHHELGRFLQSPQQSVLVISRAALPVLLKRLPTDARRKLMVIHDEVHGLGMPGIRDGSKSQHADFPYVLGLSATPERAYDEDGNQFILSEVGNSIFRFPLEAAIARGILCEFSYVPLEYQLTDDDRQRLAQVYALQSARAHAGNPMSKEEVWIEISKVYKTAEMKPLVFSRFLESHPKSLERSIIFVETKEYGSKILDIIHKYTNLYRTHYAEDDSRNLDLFSRGDIDCLITCHRISQGIDIKSLKTAFLFSSARAQLETVQRIGRCLRTDPSEPDKRALVIDFVRPQDENDDKMNADTERSKWLKEISLTKKGDEIDY